MDDRILAAAEVIGRPEGESFLRFMSDVYFGKAHRESDGRDAPSLATAEKIGMIQKSAAGLTFTAPGFLVGNVAKEYCQYVEDGRALAPPKPSSEMIAGKDLLDLGCGFGCSLWEFQREARSAVGLEKQEEYIILGRALSAQEKVAVPKIINAPAEELDRHFGPESLDVIFTRLVLNYVKVKPVLKKMVAALRPNGTLWILVDSPAILPARLMMRDVSLLRRSWVLLALLNLPVCVLTGRQLSVSWRGRMHAQHHPVYPPLWWWRRELQRHGLKNFRTFPAKILAFCAQK